MSSISVGDLKLLLEDLPEDFEVIMKIKHRHDIPKESGEKGWIAFINALHCDYDHNIIELMN